MTDNSKRSTPRTPTIEQMRRELKELGWVEESLTLYCAPCGCYFRGPYRAWLEATGTHVAAHFASQSGVA